MAHTQTILVVDDDDMARDVITRLLKRALPQVSVEAATDGESGWEKYAKLRPALLVTDLKMGKMTGGELIGKVRAADPLIPIFVITGAPEVRPVPGASEVILKVDFDHLISRARAVLEALSTA